MSSSDINNVCDFKDGSCTRTVDSLKVTISVEPAPPVPMKETVFVVNIEGNEILSEKLIMNFTMPDMYMGRNQIILKRVSKNVFKGKGVIPICPLGRTRWNAEVFLSPAETLRFGFHVKY